MLLSALKGLSYSSKMLCLRSLERAKELRTTGLGKVRLCNFQRVTILLENVCLRLGQTSLDPPAPFIIPSLVQTNLWVYRLELVASRLSQLLTLVLSQQVST